MILNWDWETPKTFETWNAAILPLWASFPYLQNGGRRPELVNSQLSESFQGPLGTPLYSCLFPFLPLPQLSLYLDISFHLEFLRKKRNTGTFCSLVVVRQIQKMQWYVEDVSRERLWPTCHWGHSFDSVLSHTLHTCAILKWISRKITHASGTSEHFTLNYLHFLFLERRQKTSQLSQLGLKFKVSWMGALCHDRCSMLELNVCRVLKACQQWAHRAPNTHQHAPSLHSELAE